MTKNTLKNHLKSFRKSLAKVFFDKKKRNVKTFDISKAKSILFLRNDDKIGDMVISTILFREIKKQYPDIKVFVLCGKNNSEIIKHNPYVDKIFETSGNFFRDFSVFRRLKKYNIDVLVDFSPFRPRPTHMYMLRIVSAGFVIGFHKNGYNLYDQSLDTDLSNQHITKVYKELLEYFKVYDITLKYDVFLHEDEENYAKDIVKQYKGFKTVFLNSYAAKKRKNFITEKLKDLTAKLLQDGATKIILNTTNEIRRTMAAYDGIYIPERKNILYAAALIKYSDIVISPDTSIVHIAAAFDKKMIALYLDDSTDAEKLNTIWSPNYDKAVLMAVDTKNGTLNDVNNISNDDILKVYDGIFS